jgi:NIPSNAP
MGTRKPTGETTVHTLCIRYTLDPNALRHFRTYVADELPVIVRSGGQVVGYFLPTDFAGPTNIAYGLIDFPSLSAYEHYRAVLGVDPDHQRNVAALERTGVVLATERSFIERAASA